MFHQHYGFRVILPVSLHSFSDLIVKCFPVNFLFFFFVAIVVPRRKNPKFSIVFSEVCKNNKISISRQLDYLGQLEKKKSPVIENKDSREGGDFAGWMRGV